MVDKSIFALHATMPVLLLQRVQIAWSTILLSWWFNQFILVVSCFYYVQILNLDRLFVLLVPTGLHYVELESIELNCCLVGLTLLQDSWQTILYLLIFIRIDFSNVSSTKIIIDLIRIKFLVRAKFELTGIMTRALFDDVVYNRNSAGLLVEIHRFMTSFEQLKSLLKFEDFIRQRQVLTDDFLAFLFLSLQLTHQVLDHVVACFVLLLVLDICLRDSMALFNQLGMNFLDVHKLVDYGLQILVLLLELNVLLDDV